MPGLIHKTLDLIHLAYVMLPYLFFFLWVEIILHRFIRGNKQENLKNTTLFQDIKIRIIRHAFHNLRLSQGAMLTGILVSRMMMRLKTAKYDSFKKIYSKIYIDDIFKGVWYADKERQRADDDLVVYLVHGGGFCICCVEFYTEFCLELRRHLRERGYEKVSIFAIEYDIVPKARFPLALRAVTAGYSYLVKVEKINPNKIVLLGDSAGGNLSMAMLLHIARPSSLILGQELSSLIQMNEKDHASGLWDMEGTVEILDEPRHGKQNTSDTTNTVHPEYENALHKQGPHRNFHFEARAAAILAAERADPLDASQASSQRILPKPALAAIISPWCMFDSDEKSYHENQSSDVLTFPHVKHVARIYCHAEDEEYPRNWNPIRMYNGTATGRKDGKAHRDEDEEKFMKACANPYINPGACKDEQWWQEALPSYGTLFTAGTAELFRDDAIKAFEMAKKAGIPKTNLIVDEGVHDWVCLDLLFGGGKGMDKYRGPRLLSRWIIKRMRQVPGATGVPAEDVHIQVTPI